MVKRTFPSHKNVIDEVHKPSSKFKGAGAGAVKVLSGFDFCFVIGVSRPCIDSVWAPKVAKEDNERAEQAVFHYKEPTLMSIADDDEDSTDSNSP
ncbi:unnamed protein product [Ilex paraguariensis]|uniref:Uncharacterized protein n=1 Tax=Ilex paraguariensis TaxID=185542 RepID=A0ABC8TGE7_9AQUA